MKCCTESFNEWLLIILTPTWDRLLSSPLYRGNGVPGKWGNKVAWPVMWKDQDLNPWAGKPRACYVCDQVDVSLHQRTAWGQGQDAQGWYDDSQDQWEQHQGDRWRSGWDRGGSGTESLKGEALDPWESALTWKLGNLGACLPLPPDLSPGSATLWWPWANHCGSLSLDGSICKIGMIVVGPPWMWW